MYKGKKTLFYYYNITMERHFGMLKLTSYLSMIKKREKLGKLLSYYQEFNGLSTNVRIQDSDHGELSEDN